MVVSVIFDNDLKARVFQIRDSERYTNSTKTSLEVEYWNNRTDYVTVTLTASVDGALGKSSVAFYCDNEFVGVDTFDYGDTSAETTIQVAYGYHKYYAKYLGNVECLASKSGIVELEVTEPNIAKSMLTINAKGVVDDWASKIGDVTFSITLQNKNTLEKLDGKKVNITLDDTYSATATSNKGVITLPSTILSNDKWANGEHNLKLVFEGDEEYIGVENSIKISIGYIVTLSRRYATVGVGDSEIFDVNVSKPDGTPVEGVNVTLQRG